MNEILSALAEFMRLTVEHNGRHFDELQAQRQEIRHMAETLQSVKDKVAQQSALIDQLAAEKSTREQADLDAIGAAIDDNTAKLTTALQPAGQQG